MQDVGELYNIIPSNIQSEEVTCKSVDTVVEADEAASYSTTKFNSKESAMDATSRATFGTPRANYHLAKYTPAKALHQHAACSNNIVSNVVEARMLTGPFKREDVLIPRIPITPRICHFNLGEYNCQFVCPLQSATTKLWANPQNCAV